MTAYCSVPGTALSALLTFPQAMLASLGARGSFCPYHPGRRLRHRTSAVTQSPGPQSLCRRPRPLPRHHTGHSQL